MGTWQEHKFESIFNKIYATRLIEIIELLENMSETVDSSTSPLFSCKILN